MAAWVHMSQHILFSEFPDFELISCFSVFHVSLAPADHSEDTVETQRRMLQKLSNVFGVDPARLIEQYYDLLPIAQAIKRRGECDGNPDTWRVAVGRCTTRSSTHFRHPTDALVPVLVRLCAWGVSTSAVERGFANTSKHRQGQSEDGCVSRELDVLQIRSDCADPADRDRLAASAMIVWSDTFGNAREGRGWLKSLRVGRSQRQSVGTGEAAFLRMRREASARLAGDMRPTDPGITEDLVEFNDKQLAERALRTHLLTKRKIVALSRGHLAEAEVDDELQEAAQKQLKKDIQSANNIKAEHTRKIARANKQARVAKLGVVFVCVYLCVGLCLCVYLCAGSSVCVCVRERA